MTKDNPSHAVVRNSCRNALRRGFVAQASHIPLDAKGYVAEIGDNLMPGVSLADFERDLLQGDGSELRLKFRAVHSSSALAVNCFAPFRSTPHALSFPGGSGFTAFSFERKCPHGIGRQPPNLDLVAEGPEGIVAVESKCLEPLSPHVANFAPVYFTHITDERRKTSWFAEMQRLAREPRTYRWLDAAQLVKHALGVSYMFPSQSAVLLYIYWEPSDKDAFSVFAEHRAEIGRFAASIQGGGGPEFVAMSYPELWKLWETPGSPDWLRSHLARLRARYLVAAEEHVA